MRRVKNAEDRFWKKVSKPLENNDCWLWAGSVTKAGYGSFWSESKFIYVHRYSYELHYGKIPDSLHVLHKCDTPRCVNPKHFFLGTNEDNIRDKVKKGRTKTGLKCGEANINAKLVENDILLIRQSTKNNSAIGREYNVSSACIAAIRLYKTWRHVV